MMTCSTSSIGTCASFEMTLNGNVARSCVGRRNTASSSAIMQIFCRRDGRFCSRKGCGPRCHTVSCPAGRPRTRNGGVPGRTTHLLGVHLRNQSLELGDVARIEREQQAADKVVLRPLERIQDRVHQLRSRAMFRNGQSTCPI